MIDYSLYLCTDSTINPQYNLEDCVKQAIIGGVTVVQIREKNKKTEDIIRVANKIKTITDYYNIPLIINDDIDAAIIINAAGVHIGQNDISCLEARKKLGKDKIIGVTVTTLEQAKIAISQGASYLGVGAIYKSITKKDAEVVKHDEFVKILENCNIPIVVIGGINERTIPDLKKYNISGYAMIRPILGSQNIIESARKLKKIISTKE